MKSLIFVVLSVAILPTPLSAALLFSNLAQSQDNDGGLSATDQSHATEFLTGSDPSIVTNASIRVMNFDTAPHTFGAYLYSDNAGSPGTLLATFSPVDNSIATAIIPNNTATIEVLTFSHVGIPLAANTQYWLALAMLENSTNHSTALVETDSNLADAGSIFSNNTPPNRHTSSDSGSSWTVGSARNGQFSLEGVIVPEPSTLALIGSATGAILLMSRLRRRGK